MSSLYGSLTSALIDIIIRMTLESHSRLITWRRVSCGFREDFDDQQMGSRDTRPNIQSRIIGGVDSLPGEWPWMVSLQMDEDNFCGGSIISHWWILTASHCLLDVSVKKLQVLVGHTELKYATDRVNVEKIIMHPQYSKTSGNNDIALLLLSFSLRFNKLIVPICLPSGRAYQPGDWKTCYVTGWGTTISGRMYFPTVLKKVKILLYSINQCQDWMGSLTDNMLCAGISEGGKDACQGDSGGPLVCRFFNTKTWYQIGVVSWGRGCGEPRKPGIYVVVSNYIEWIRNVSSTQGRPLEVISPATRAKGTESMTNDAYDFGNVTSSTNQSQNMVYCSSYFLAFALGLLLI
ncbi:serine protease 55-like isoform X2 [Rhinoderma darwinii]|uniref:serine protease 55-like isoform X2 n=1 Tax=Rhinoderma darwinii TaxID=43563 RepID=UPI003F669A92